MSEKMKGMILKEIYQEKKKRKIGKKKKNIRF